MARGIVGSLTSIAVAGSGVVAGRVAYNLVNQKLVIPMIPAAATTTTAAAYQLAGGALVAVALKYAGKRLGARGKEFTDYAAAGAFAAPLMNLLQALAPSAATTYLADVTAMPRFRMQHQVGSYPNQPAMGAYPSAGADTPYSYSNPY